MYFSFRLMTLCVRACVHARVFVCLMSVSVCGHVCAMVHVCHDKSQSTTFLKLGFFFPSNLVFGRASLVRFVIILDITG